MLHTASNFSGLDPVVGSWEHGLSFPSQCRISGFSRTLLRVVIYLSNYMKTKRIADLCTVLWTKTTECWAYIINVQTIRFKRKFQLHQNFLPLFFWQDKLSLTHSSSESQYRYRHVACLTHHSLYCGRTANMQSTEYAWDHEWIRRRTHASIKNNNTLECIHSQ
jgi:hypothetical protein